MRKKYACHIVGLADDIRTQAVTMMTVNRESYRTSAATASYDLSPTTYPQLRSLAATKMYGDLWEGAVSTSVAHNPVVEVELPFYSNRRFYFPRNYDGNITTDQQGSYNSVIVSGISNLDQYVSVTEFTSVADDFSLYFYVGCPALYDLSVNGGQGRPTANAAPFTFPSETLSPLSDREAR